MRDTTLDRVRFLVGLLEPLPICDDCISSRLGLAVRQCEMHTTGELAGTQAFERQVGECAICGVRKRVIRSCSRTH